MTATMVNRAEQTVAPGERWLKSICNSCVSNTCGMRVLVRNGKVIRAEGDPENPFNKGRLCAKAHALVFAINDPNRIRRPLRRTNQEKGIGVDPKWVEISYEEAYDLVAKALKEQRKRDPRRLMTMSGMDFSTNQWAGPIISTPWGDHLRPQVGAYCGNSVHPQTHVNWGTGHVFPDWKYINYLILMGSQKGANINHSSLTAAMEVAEARSRGAKIVSVDPLGTNMPSKATEWLPIRPGTDGALVLAWMHTLINELGIYDVEFLRTYTNAPYLIKEDGHYVRDAVTNKPVMWDEVSGSAMVYDDPELTRPALEGRYRVRLPDGKSEEARTAFAVLKEQVRTWTPERVSDITSIPVDTIRRIAREFGEAANIGSTVVIDGEMLPYRPVGIHWYRGISGHRNGYNTGRLTSLLNVLVGAIDVPGGMLGEGVYMDPPGLRERSLINGDLSGLIDGGDGILWPSGGPVSSRRGRHTGRVVRRPETGPDGRPLGMSFRGLFPSYGSSVVTGDMLDPERHGKALSPLPPETILCFFNNSIILNATNPDGMVQIELDPENWTGG